MMGLFKSKVGRRGQGVTLRKLAFVALVAALGMTAAACGSDSSDAGTNEGPKQVDKNLDPAWKKIVDAANKEGEVVLYTNQTPAAMDRMVDAFGKAYPDIELKANRISGTDATSRLEEEKKTGSAGADLFVTSEIAWQQARNKEKAIIAPSGPASKDFPSKYLIDGAIAAVTMEPVVLAYNTNLVKEPIKSYEDLLRPDLGNGKIGTSDSVATSIVAFYTDYLESLEGPDYVEELAAQEPRLYAGSIPSAQAVAAGEIFATAFTNTSTAQPLIDQGAPIKIVLMKPNFSFNYGASVLGWAKHPNAAQVLQDWMMSREGQEVLCSTGGDPIYASPLEGIKNTFDASAFQAFDPTRYPADAVATYRKTFDGLFK